MQINNLNTEARYSALSQMEEIQKNKINDADSNDQQIEEAASEFTSIFIEKMFSSMKKTLSDEKLIDGGYAEDVFTDMLYKEYSLMAGKGGMLAQLNKTLIEQLKSR